MAERTWNMGDKPPASDFQNDLQNQVVVNCTSTTRGSLWTGKKMYETDTDRLMYSPDGATVQLMVPRFVRSTTITTTGPSTGTHAEADVNGSQMNVNTYANTRYLIYWQWALTSSASNDVFIFRSYRGSTFLNQWNVVTGAWNTYFPLSTYMTFDTPGVGSPTTYKLTVEHPGGSGTWSIQPDAGFGYVQQFSGT